MTKSNKIAAKRIAIAVAAVCASLAMPATAADNKALLDLMLKKGVITQKDYDEFVEATKDADENKAFKEQRLDQDVTKAVKFMQKREKDGAVKSSGFGWVSEDGKNEINLTGRLHYDARMFGPNWGNESVDRDTGSGADRFTVRRARIGVTGVFNKDFNYEMVTNLTGATANNGSTNSTATIDTAWVNYTVSPEAQFRFGRMKQPMAMETLTSSNNIDFMERSYLDQLSPGKQNGMMFHGEKNGFVYSLSGWQMGFDPVTDANGLSPQVGGRVATNLAQAIGGAGGDTIAHLGFSYMSGKQEVVPTTSSQKGGNTETKGAFLAFRDENLGQTNVFRNRIYGYCSSADPKAGGSNNCDSTNNLKGYALPSQEAAQVNKTMAAFEAAVANGPLKLQYEYADAKLSAKANAWNGTSVYPTQSSGHAKVQYLSLMWNITGEEWKDVYKGGLFGGIKPKSNFNFKDGSGSGAWQLGFRMSSYDASDFGKTTNGTVPADEETTAGNGKHGCDGSFQTTPTCYQLGGSPKGTTYTIGLNWILNPNARVMLNYSRSEFANEFYPVDGGTPNSKTRATDHSDVISLRTQFNF